MLKKELVSWVTAYKDVAERNALAEDPDESADYLVSLFKAEVDKLTVIGNEEISVYKLYGTEGLAGYDIRGLLTAQLQDTKKQLLEVEG